MSVQFDANHPTITVELIFPSPVGTVDVTEYIESCSTMLGRRREGDRYAGTATLELSNWDGRFTTANLSGPYVDGGVSFVRPRVGVRIEATWSSTDYAVWFGEVRIWQDTFAANGQDPRTLVHCVDASARLARWDGVALSTPVGGGERSGERIDRILTAADWPYAADLMDGSIQVTETTLEGLGSAQIQLVVDAEGGAFWVDAAGTAVFEDRAALATETRSNTSQVTFSDASVFFRNPTTSQDEMLIRNTVTLQRDGGEPQTATDATSVGLYGTCSWVRTGLPAESDAELAGLAELAVIRWAEPEYRVDEVTIDPAASPSLMWPHALGRKIRDRATVAVEVAQSGLTITRGVFIEGIAQRFSQHSWETTFFFSSATPWDSISGDRWDSGLWDTAVWFF